MKKFLSVFLVCLLLVSTAAASANAGQDNFVPVIRFIAASDTHVAADNSNSERIKTMLSEAYALSGADRNYSKLDALLIAGDLTNNGTKEQFDMFKAAVTGSLRKETQFLAVVAKNHDGWNMSRKEMRDYYSGLMDIDADFHKVINGYHFIGVSASENDSEHYSVSQINWLREQLDAATAEDPDKPVFVTHHEHNTATVYGSSLYDGWGMPWFKELLNMYPQVVDFSGHSHYPLNDPRSIWQGGFTAIGTGAIYYSEFTIDEFRAYHPSDSGATSTYWIVEVDANNRIHLRGMDLLANKQLCEYTLDNPANLKNREYTPAKQKARSKPPVFDKGAELTITPAYGGCKVTIPAAQSADGMPVTLYRVRVKNALGITIFKEWALPHYYLADGPDTVEFTVENIAAGKYTVSVTAETAYGVQSSPLEEKIEIEGESQAKGIILCFERIFAHIKVFFENIFG